MLAMKHELDKEQKEELDFALANPYVIYELPMGFGKTALGIAIKNSLKGAKTLVVCPSGLKYNWKKEIDKFLDGQSVTIIKSKSDIYYPVDSDFVILPYSLLAGAECLFEWANIVISDESSSLKSMKANRTELFHKYIYENSIERLYMMTGTPIKNRVWEFYSLIALANYNPKIKDSAFLKRFPEYISFADYFSYRHEFEKYVGNKKIKVLRWDGLRNVDELKKWLKGIRRKREPKTGPLIIKNILMSEKENTPLYEVFSLFMEGLGSSVESSIKAQAAMAKVPFTIEYVESILDEVEKVIIVSDHVEPTKTIAAHFGVEAITGATPAAKRQEIVDAFEAGKTNVLVGTIGTLKEGYTIISAWNMVLNDFCWVPGDLDQLYARINRRGQTRQCVIHHIDGSPQDEYIRDTLAEKKAVIKQV